MGVMFRPSKWFEDATSVGDDTRSIAPAIGIILLVGIVLVLAASTGAFVFDDRNQPDEASPVTVFDFEYHPGDRLSGDELTVTHIQGDTIAGQRLDLRIRNVGYESELGYEADASRAKSASFFEVESVTAGDSTTVTTEEFRRGLAVGLVADQDFDLSKAEVCVVWQTAENGSEPLKCWRGPDTEGFVE
jgi:FlaG/FlaF family flagellin (archaellin)